MAVTRQAMYTWQVYKYSKHLLYITLSGGFDTVLIEKSKKIQACIVPIEVITEIKGTFLSVGKEYSMQETTTELTAKEKARLMKNAYQRQWAKNNPDKIKAYQEKHYAKRYDEMIQQMVDDFAEDHERGDIDE